MKKTISIVIFVVVFVGALVLLNGRTSQAPGPVADDLSPTGNKAESAEVNKEVASTPFSQILEITITAGGLSTKNLTARVGDVVKFTNFDDAPHWPASDVHPVHRICPGFDALRGLTKGESYTYTFTQPQACPFHDHINARRDEYNGVITVTK